MIQMLNEQHLPGRIKPDGCTSDLFCLSTAVLRSRKMCPSWFTAVCQGRSAGTDRALHTLPASPQNRTRTHTSTLKHRHAATVQAAAENICRVQTPTCHQPSVFAFLWRICICRKTSNIHAPSLQMCYTWKKHNKSWRALQPWLPVLCQLLPWCRSLLFTAGRSSCPGSTPGENTGSPHWAVLGEPTSGANDLLTCSLHGTVSCHIICLATVRSQNEQRGNNPHLHVPVRPLSSAVCPNMIF